MEINIVVKISKRQFKGESAINWLSRLTAASQTAEKYFTAMEKKGEIQLYRSGSGDSLWEKNRLRATVDLANLPSIINDLGKKVKELRFEGVLQVG